MKKKIIQILFIVLLLVVIFIRLNHEKNKPYKETRFALGTFITIDIQDKKSHNKEIVDSVFDDIQKLERQFSSTYENSETDVINCCNDSCTISENMLELIRISEYVSKASNGAFDITIGKILPYYDFVTEQMPSDKEIDSLKSYIDYSKIHVEKNTFYKEDSDIVIDFGGIAKGYIVDQAVHYLKDRGVKYAAINAGGDLYVMQNPETDTWKIGIQHPRKNDHLLGSIEVSDMAVVTSGDYEQYYTKDGTRIHHIIDPSTGLPSHESISVTVIAPEATYADALCTALFIMGPKQGIELINDSDDIDALIVYESNNNLEYVISENFDKYNFTLLDSTVKFIKD